MKTGKFRQYRWIWLLVILLVTGLACRLGSNTPATPTSPIPVSTEDAGKFEEQLKQAAEQAHKGETIELSFTEAELTSYLSIRLQDQPGLQLSDVQVYLRDGKVQIFANYVEGPLSLPLKVIFIPKVDAQGNASLELESMKMGSIPVPDSLKSRIQEEANNTINQMLSDSGEHLFIESLMVQDGSLNLRGRPR